MSLALAVFVFVVGLFLVTKGGSSFVTASQRIAELCGIPKLIIGATIVSIGTTLPEILVSAFAAVDGKAEMAIGNSVGSVTANMGFILGLSIAFSPVVIKRSKYIKNALFILFAPAILFLFTADSKIGAGAAVVLAALFIAFIGDNIYTASKDMKLSEAKENITAERRNKKDISVTALQFIIGALCIAIGAALLVKSGSELARLFGVSERIIGVTALALGTSLPELVTAVTSAAKRQYSISLGNLLGAGIIDIFVVVPLCVAVGGAAEVSYSLLFIDIPMCFAVCAVAIIPALIKRRFMRWQGFALLCMYLVYFLCTCGFITV